MNRNQITIGCDVAFNTLDDATWFTVTQIDDFILTVVESGTDYAPQRADVSTVKQVRQPAANDLLDRAVKELRGLKGDGLLSDRYLSDAARNERIDAIIAQHDATKESVR